MKYSFMSFRSVSEITDWLNKTPNIQVVSTVVDPHWNWWVIYLTETKD